MFFLWRERPSPEQGSLINRCLRRGRQRLCSEGPSVKGTLNCTDRDRPGAPVTQPGPRVCGSANNRSPSKAGQPRTGHVLTFTQTMTGLCCLCPACWCQHEEISWSQGHWGHRNTLQGRGRPSGSNGRRGLCCRHGAPAALDQRSPASPPWLTKCPKS